jgi:hypothetical protein
VGRYVQVVRASAVHPGQEGELVQPIHSTTSSIAEKMDNWMDNFSIPDVSDRRAMGHLEQPQHRRDGGRGWPTACPPPKIVMASSPAVPRASETQCSRTSY